MPTFEARRDYVGLFTFATIAADTNGDGIPDLISMAGSLVYVLFGNGDGTFRTGPSSQTTGAGSSPVAVDLNGDGNVDLVTASFNSSSVAGIAVSFGNGDGTFQPGTFYPAGTDNERTEGYLTVGDFTGDGILDVAQVDESGVWLFTGRRNGTFKAGVLVVSLTSGGLGIASADFNGDGHLDLAVSMPNTGGGGDQGDGFYIIFGNGNGTFQTPQHFSNTPGRIYEIVAGPLGPHGYPGLAMLIVSSNAVAVYFGNGAGEFTGPSYVGLPNGEGGEPVLAIGDLNGDGISDLVTAFGYAYIAYGTASGSFEKAVEFPIQYGDGVFYVSLADLRNDGRTDIITDSDYGLSVLLNQTRGHFEDGLWTKLSSGAGCGVSGDFNGDGKPDLAVNTGTGIQVLLGTGKALTPLAAGQSITLAGAGCLRSGQASDINGDGILDLVLTSSSGVVAYLGNGDGTFTLKSTTPTSTGSGYLVLADFNRDGKLDFATAGNLWALGNGDGTFQTPQPITITSGDFNNVAVGDVNNDGWPDLVLTTLNEPAVYLALNNQADGFTQGPTVAQYGSAPILTDLNGDGNLDLVLNQYVYLGDGQGDFSYQTLLVYPVGYDSGPLFPMVADLNGDGVPDITILAPGTAEIFLGTGNAEYATPFYIGTGPEPGSILAADLHGQKAASGLPDIVAPDVAGGVMVLLNTTK